MTLIKWDCQSSESFDILSSTMRLSIADRREYVTDPNWEEIPVEGLISKDYANKRLELVGTGSVEEEIRYGEPVMDSSISTSQECNSQCCSQWK